MQLGFEGVRKARIGVLQRRKHLMIAPPDQDPKGRWIFRKIMDFLSPAPV